MSDVRHALAEAHHREWAYVLAAAVRAAGDLDVAEAAEAYEEALALATNASERRFLAQRRSEMCDAGARAPEANYAA